MHIKTNTVNRITYTKKNDPTDVSQRTIIPVDVPATVVRAYDVSKLTQPETDELLMQLNEYNEYRTNYMKQCLSFANWYEHTHGKQLNENVVMKSFSPEGITFGLPA
jgi:hypothetical protein